jgi:hypothetical protein
MKARESQVQGQPELHSETCLKKKKERETEKKKKVSVSETQ